jgi:putative ABC transport system substrate-binding protein
VKRRTFLAHVAALTGAAAGALFLGGCQTLPFASAPRRGRRVGFVTGSGATPTTAMLYDLFRSTLAQYGWMEGDNLTLEFRYPADGNLDDLPRIAAELVELPVDVLVASGSSVVAAKGATDTIPIVAVGSGDLVALGLVSSLAHPGGNLTGVPANLPGTVNQVKWLELLQSIVPGLIHVAVLINPTHTSSADLSYPGLESAATPLGVDLLRLEVRTPEDLESAFSQARAWQAQAVIVPPDGGMLNVNAGQIARLALHNRLPSITSFKSFADAGFMLSFGVDTKPLYARAAFFVDRILRGAKPADLPIEEPRTLQLVVNMKTVQALGVTIPSDVAAQVTDWIQ